MSQLSAEVLVAMLEGGKGAGNFLDAAKVHLTGDPYIPTPLGTVDDMAAHEASYDGYAPSAPLVFQEAYIKPDGTAILPAASVQFIPTGSTNTAMIHGWWIETGVAPANKVVAFQAFQNPVSLGSKYDALTVNPEISVRNNPPV